jgi:hypothetical protein
MSDLFKPHQCPRCFGLFKVGDRFWNDSGNVYHWVCWVNKSKEKTDDRAINDAVEAEREACCAIVYGQCESDNVAQRTVDAIRARGTT